MWTTAWTLLPALLLLCPLKGYAANFTFAYGAAGQCDDFQVSWSGGTAPYQLTLAHVYGTTRTMAIPASSISNGNGTFTTTLPFAANQQFLAIMSDATGFASGGVSKPITVGKSTSKQACNTTDPGVDFFFEANLALAQCRSYTFSGYDGAVQPITIQGLVPGGSSFVLNPPKGPVSYDWITDIAAGTNVVFIATDAQGRQGGCSQVYLVGMSDDATCLDKTSPSSVRNAPSRTSPPVVTPTHSGASSSVSASASSSATASAAPDNGSSSKGNGGTIAAAIIGCLVAAIVVGTLIWFYLRRHRGTSVLKGRVFSRFHKKEVDLMHDPSLPPPAAVNPYPLYHPHGSSQFDVSVSTPNSTLDLLGESSRGATENPFGAGSVYTPSSAFFPQQRTSNVSSLIPPPAFHRGSFHEGSVHGSSFGRPDEGSTMSWDQTVTSGMRRKAAAAGISPYAPSARFILHTDLEDDLPPPPEDEVIELPPQYTERRRPTAGPSSPTSPGASGSGLRSRPSRESDLPPPPSPTGGASSPGLAYLRDSAAGSDDSASIHRPNDNSRRS
ncbi:hypothetical protein BC628DRAFT_1339050 [Trametes gibbosa]|nr:hypothetical protein BC628DRAFT_1339050 [Trametes gibbosa]